MRSTDTSREQEVIESELAVNRKSQELRNLIQTLESHKSCAEEVDTPHRKATRKRP